MKLTGIALITLGVLATPLAGDAHYPTVPWIVILRSVAMPSPSDPTFVRPHAAFHRELLDRGYVDDEDFLILYRWGEGNADRLSPRVERVRSKVKVFVTESEVTTHAAKRTMTIPIVMAGVGYALEGGFVASLARSGGNVTGVSLPSRDLSRTRLEVLRDALPRLSRLAVLWNPASPTATVALRDMEVAALALGLRLQILDVRDPNDLERAFSVRNRERADALAVIPNPMFLDQRQRIAELAVKSGLPAIADAREFAEAGGFMAYGPNRADVYRRAAVYVDQILKGAKAADLPVEQPAKFELVINLKTAKALGLTIPQSVLIQADEVIHP